jgi:hypothetical protein
MASPQYSNAYPNAGWAFNVAVAPAVTAGAYAAGDIIGGLLTFPNVAQAANRLVVINDFQVTFKSNVTPTLILTLFEEDPAASAKNDNDAYSVVAADAFKVLRTFDFAALGGAYITHGTPKSISINNLGAVIPPVAGGRSVLGLLRTTAGVTLGSVSDMQIRMIGVGA